jgi:UDP-N-acetylglucosamine 2-epimerase (non-hydrolysing)
MLRAHRQFRRRMSRSIDVLIVAGARPNFMKVAPLLQELLKYPEFFRTRFVHTGQHYDAEMSDVFFDDLEMPRPDRFLGIGSGSHAEQTARVMLAFEQVCAEEQPNLVIVVGDVNSTMACAITAKKLCVAVAHVEAGLRSRDWTMPEEVNRVLTDAISDFLLTPSRDANDNLLHEGVAPQRIHFVGNVMIIMAYTKNTSPKRQSDSV